MTPTPRPGSGPGVHRRPVPLPIDLATPEPIPEDGIRAAVALMESGALFRYSENAPTDSPVAAWESEFAAWAERTYAVAVNSCGAALYLALHCQGVEPGQDVLLNSWTLAPVPGAVAHVGARPVFVETTADLTIDLDHLRDLAAAHPGCVLLLSHMRGHIADMTQVVEICHQHGLRLVEDCAHSLGGGWDGQATGTFGAVGCFSTQTYKHLNSGEGGILTTDDEEIAARAILASGSYRLHAQHSSRPDLSRFDPFLGGEPNHSMRLSAMAAAVLRPQLPRLPDRVRRWRALYDRLSAGLEGVPSLRLPRRDEREAFVGSSLQFFLPGLEAETINRFCEVADELGVHVKWFGAPRPSGFTSSYRSWSYASGPVLPQTDALLAGLCDLRIPLALDEPACGHIVEIIRYALEHAARNPAPLAKTDEERTA